MLAAIASVVAGLRAGSVVFLALPPKGGGRGSFSGFGLLEKPNSSGSLEKFAKSKRCDLTIGLEPSHVIVASDTHAQIEQIARPHKWANRTYRNSSYAILQCAVGFHQDKPARRTVNLKPGCLQGTVNETVNVAHRAYIWIM
ncbi:MAG: hypothetical protein WBQ75_17560 [Acetobacteraceae bacterium]